MAETATAPAVSQENVQDQSRDAINSVLNKASVSNFIESELKRLRDMGQAPPADEDDEASSGDKRKGNFSASLRRFVRQRTDENGLEAYPTDEELRELTNNRSRSALFTWYKFFNLLMLHKEEHGDCNVTQSSGNLGRWVNKQREHYKQFVKGEKSPMTPKKVAMLEAIGFEWAKSKGFACWKSHFDDLKKYKDEHGHCDFPTKSKDHTALSRWVTEMRKLYKAGTLTQDKVDLLESIGFQWSKAESQWHANFERLKEYHAKHDDCCVTRLYDPALNWWVLRQRCEYRKLMEHNKTSSMTEYRFKQLNQLGFFDGQMTGGISSSMESMRRVMEEEQKAKEMNNSNPTDAQTAVTLLQTKNTEDQE